MFEPERRQAVDVFGFDVIARGYELVQGGVHIDCVPEHDEIDHQSERPEGTSKNCPDHAAVV